MLPVVFVHGLIGPFSDTRTVSLLRPAVVVSPDLLGYGAEADADPSEITIEAQVEYVRATVDRMAPNSRMHLVWHSVGGVIAASFVHRFPRWCHMLRDAAAARGMTQERVADATTPHVHNSTKQQNTKQQKEGKKIGLGKIKRIWNAHEKPTADEMLRLCEALGLPKVRMLAELGMVAPESDREAYIDQLEEIASRITYTAGRVKVEQPHAAAVIAARRRRQPGDPQRPDHRSLASRRRA